MAKIKTIPSGHVSIPHYDMGDPPNGNKSNPEALLNSLSGTRFDPLLYPNWANTEEKARQYLINHNIRINEDAQDVRNFFDSYTHSDGYQRIIDNQYKWLEQRHPYRKWIYPKGSVSSEPSWYASGKKLSDLVRDDNVHQNNYSRIFTLDGYPTMSFNTNFGTFVYNGYKNDDFPDTFILAHEYAHRFPQYYPGNREVLDQNKNTEKGHDSDTSEKHSDIWGLKYLLYKEGIYDSRGKKDIKPIQIEKLRKKYPTLRPLLQMDNKKAAWMLNNVTKNMTINIPQI